jgi:glycerol kinase
MDASVFSFASQALIKPEPTGSHALVTNLQTAACCELSNTHICLLYIFTGVDAPHFEYDMLAVAMGWNSQMASVQHICSAAVHTRNHC